MRKMLGLFLRGRLAYRGLVTGFVLATMGANATTNSSCPTCVLDYPYSSTNARTSVIFNESDILRAFSTNVTGRGDTIRAFYNDEHPMALGVRQVIVTTAQGSTTNNYPLAPLPTVPSAVLHPLVGSTIATGDQAGNDISGRPMFPALYITDITTNLSSKSGDWQFGGTPIPPHAVFGTWKAAVRKVDKTKNPPVVTVLPDGDTAKNHWNLGGGDPVPAGLVDEGYGAEVRWNVDELGLVHGHIYRLYFMMHDGDQNKTGGDVGHGCLNVTVVDRAPVAVNDLYTVNEDTTLTVAAPGVLANDSDIDGDPVTAILVNGPTHGSLSLSTNGGFVYQPTHNYNGPDSFTYKATDGQATSGVATVSITVQPVNDAPVAVDDSYSVNEDTLLSIPTPGVLTNDSDSDGDRLTALLVNGPSHGTLTLNPDGSLHYQAAANYNGPDSFTYKANDGSADSAPATVTISVQPINDAPVAVNDTYSVNEDAVLTVGAPGVLANDTDVDGDRLTAILVSGPSHGTLTLNPDGSFRYQGAQDYNGPDSFTYKANDGKVDSGPATVTITVRPSNDAPVAVNDDYRANEDTALLVGAPGVLANDSDLDGDPLTALLVSGPSHGDLVLNADGSFRYLAATNYNGPDSFTYKANDGTADSGTATVTITVQPINDAPVALNDSYTATEDTALTVASPGVLANDTDVDRDRLAAILMSGPTHGSLSLNADGSFRYAGATDFNGKDSFTYKASDGQATSGVVTVTITVQPVNDPPSFTKGPNHLVNEDATAQNLPNWATAISAGPPDESGQTLTFTVLNDNQALFSVQPALSPAGTLTYTPAPHAYGVAHLTVTLKDNGGTANGGVDTSAPQSFTLTINAPPLVSIIEPTNHTVFIAPANITLIAEAHDPDGTVAEVRILQGTNLLLRTNTAPYLTTWTNVMAGSYQFVAQATDDNGAIGTSAPVSVTVLAALPLIVVTPAHFNPQTGLFEEAVRILNPTPQTLPSVRVVVRDLPAGVRVFNASGPTNATPYVQTKLPIPAGGSADVTIEYYVTNFQAPNPSLSAEVVGAALQSASDGMTAIPVTRQLALANGDFLVEFSSLANRIYFVQYSADMQEWKTAWPSVAGTGNRIQWMDNGAPRTESLPASQLCRFYRIVLAP